MTSVNEAAVAELDELQNDLNDWFARSTQDLQSMYTKLTTQLKHIEDAVTRGVPLGQSHTMESSIDSAADKSWDGSSEPADKRGSQRQAAAAPTLSKSSRATPQRPTMPAADTPSMASPPVSHALNYDMLIEEVERESRGVPASSGATSGARDGHHSGPTNGASAIQRTSTRPTADGVPTEALALPKPTNRNQPCFVFVEFKRQRVLQFESAAYVPPGEFIVVGGDRGEDIGLVTYAWPVSSNIQPPNPSGRLIGTGLGKVLRVATILEVSQLQGVQSELENRAMEVAQQKVLEHNLPMQIVDAEYQFDRKKLTFFYQSQHRLDFRNLVRDLYKTFRARIWMEADN